MRRLAELASLLSCLLNVLIGTGDREVTLSAGAWELMNQGSKWGAFVVRLRGPDHCYRAWLAHEYVWRKVYAEK